jgi:hypothetical protein
MMLATPPWFPSWRACRSQAQDLDQLAKVGPKSKVERKRPPTSRRSQVVEKLNEQSLATRASQLGQRSPMRCKDPLRSTLQIASGRRSAAVPYARWYKQGCP